MCLRRAANGKCRCSRTLWRFFPMDCKASSVVSLAWLRTRSAARSSSRRRMRRTRRMRSLRRWPDCSKPSRLFIARLVTSTIPVCLSVLGQYRDMQVRREFVDMCATADNSDVSHRLLARNNRKASETRREVRRISKARTKRSTSTMGRSYTEDTQAQLARMSSR
jgi:hypothetical protein